MGNEIDSKGKLLEEFLSQPASGGYSQHVESLRREVLSLRLELARATQVKSATSPQTHLIIGDSHSDPEVSNDRYRWLGKFAASLKPNTIIDIGDWADMGSLAHFDYGKRSFEGRRYWKDIDSAIRARELFNNQLRKLKHKPRLIHTEGNHEHRITKATDNDPRLDGLISTADLRVASLGWEHFPFGVPAIVDGIAYKHYFASGTMGKAIGGDNLASSLLRRGFMSCVQGHSHLFDYAERTRADGKKVFGMSVGCYFDHYMPWAGSANDMYWRGVVVLHDVVDGYGQVEKISMETIQRDYGDKV